jgi:hypothetical protein
MQSASQQDIERLDTTKQEILYQHAHEVCVQSQLSSSHNCAAHVALKKDGHPLRAFLHFSRHSFFNYILALMSSPQSFMADPAGTLLGLIALPALHFGLLIIQFLFLFCRWTRLDILGEWVSNKYGYGLSLVNMPYPSLLDDSTAIPIHDVATAGLANPFGFPQIPPTDISEEIAPPRYFNLDIAKSLIILCALVYERDDKYVIMASEVAKRKNLLEHEKHNQVARFLLQSTKRIAGMAGGWGFNFFAISDLVSTGGPFCGLFWPKGPSKKWIVLAFKGTSPTNFSEFMVDATISHQNARSFFGNGAVHQGFYTSLIPGEHSRVNPYANILHSLKRVAKLLRKDADGEKINLWITGHSLGAALSGLVYARLLFTPKDLGDDLILRQGYMFGMPRIADSNFISAFNFAASTPYGDTSQSMWRIIDCSDVVTTVPAGLADIEENRTMLPRTSLLNYGHFGTAGIKLTGSSTGPGWEAQPGSFTGGSTMKIIQSNIRSTASPVPPRLVPITMDVFRQKIDPAAVLRWVLSFVAPMDDHFPFKYYERLHQVQTDLAI